MEDAAGCCAFYHKYILLYSQTKGVKQKYILCISGLVAYRQYIHNCSSPVDPRLAHGSESTICSSALLGLSPLSRACLRGGSPLLSLVSAMTHRHPSRLLSPQLVDGSPSSQPYTRRSRLSRLAPVLKKTLSSYIKLESRSPKGSVFHHLITQS